MVKEIVYDSDFQNKIMLGIGKLADTVKLTLGPCGRNVLMYKKAGLRDSKWDDKAVYGAENFITNDGVTVASAIRLPDPIEDMGAQLLREAAGKTNALAGDGTTTATVLTYEMIKAGNRMISAGVNPMVIRSGIKKAADFALDEIKKDVLEVKSKEDLAAVATISSQSRMIGELVGKALFEIGSEGVVNIEEIGLSFEPKLEILEGIVFDYGFLSPLMAKDKDKLVSVLEEPYILITDYKIENSREIIDLLIEVAESDAPLLIIAEEIEQEPLGLLIANNIEAGTEFVAVHPPLYGEGRTWRMDDLSVQTGANFISSKMGRSLKDVHLEDLGRAKQVKISKNRTVITGGYGDQEKINARINELRYLVDNTEYEFNRDRYKERLAKFVSSIAVIRPGGRTTLEIDEQKMRIEDAVNAGIAARKEGICQGGGTALALKAEATKAFCDTLNDDEKIGAKIFVDAMTAPVRQIAENAGVSGDNVVEKIMEKKLGFDAVNLDYCDMYERGIVDPFMVTRLAVKTAVSVASTFLTTRVGIYDFNE